MHRERTNNEGADASRTHREYKGTLEETHRELIGECTGCLPGGGTHSGTHRKHKTKALETPGKTDGEMLKSLGTHGATIEQIKEGDPIANVRGTWEGTAGNLWGNAGGCT